MTNTGKRGEREVAELYVGEENPKVPLRPIKESKGFEKVFLQPGHLETVTVELNQRSFAYFKQKDKRRMGCGAGGTYNVLVGGSSNNTPLHGQVSLKSEFTAKP